jgi:urocanate hydratase
MNVTAVLLDAIVGHQQMKTIFLLMIMKYLKYFAAQQLEIIKSGKPFGLLSKHRSCSFFVISNQIFYSNVSQP